MTSTDATVTAYVRHRIAEWLARDGTRTAADLAKLSGLTAAQISLIRAGKSGVGIKALRGLATALGTTLADLESSATEWAARNPQPPPAQTPDRYPARVKAIARAKEDGRSDRAIQAVATFQGHDADALTVEAWSNLIASFEAAFAAGKLGTKKKP